MCGNMSVKVLGSGRMGQRRRRRKDLCGTLGGDDKAGGGGQGNLQGKYIWGKEAAPVGEEEEERD